jgi:alcohol dehydrogenase (cytochrome c)
MNGRHKLIRRRTLVLSAACLLVISGCRRVSEKASIQSVTFHRLVEAAREPQNWLTYSGSYSGTRSSGLTQITPGNVKGLQLKWVLPSLDRALHEEATPLVVDGILFTVQRVNDVTAVDGASGRVIWTYAYRPSPDARNCCGRLTRGLAIAGRTLFLATLDARLIALDAETGAELWNVAVANPKEGYAFTHAPLVVKDLVIEGTAGGEYGIRGFITALDVNTGKEVWRFHTVPGPGERGHETWAGDSWKTGGTPVWLTGSYDPETNLTFWGTGNPAPDYNGDGRAGDNLYSCSVIALKADTGKLKWYYQFSPHNEFDWDSVQIPVLVDLMWQEGPRKAMLWANRNGMFYMLDRTSGELLFSKPFVKINWATSFNDKGQPSGGLPFKSGTRVYPDDLGATNWYSPSYSARTGLFYIPARENSSSVFVRRDRLPEYRMGLLFTGGRPDSRRTNAPAHSVIRAIDPLTGATKWDYPLGDAPLRAGILTTMADLLFGGSPDGRFYALDARDGTLLWQSKLDSAISAAPMTFSVAGRQYVAVQARDSLFTFTLGGR